MLPGVERCRFPAQSRDAEASGRPPHGHVLCRVHSARALVRAPDIGERFPAVRPGGPDSLRVELASPEEALVYVLGRAAASVAVLV